MLKRLETYVRHAATQPLYAAARRERQKSSKYEDIARKSGREIEPLVVEAHGALGVSCLRAISTCGALAKANNCHKHLAMLSRNPWLSRRFEQYWRQRFSVALQQGNYYHAPQPQ